MTDAAHTLDQTRNRTIKRGGRCAGLIAEGFFDEGRTGSAACTELLRRGFSTAKPNVYKALDALALQGFVTKEDSGYRSVKDMKVKIVER